MRCFRSILFLLLLAGLFSRLDAQSTVSPDTTIDVLSYYLELGLVDNFTKKNQRAFEGKETIRMVIRSIGSDRIFKLHATQSTIIPLKASGAGFVKHAEGRLFLKLPPDTKQGDSITIVLNYRHSGAKDEGLFVSSGSVFTNNAPVEARDWFICNDHPADKALFSISVVVPANVTVGAVGLLEEVKDTTGGKKWTWRSIHPMATYQMVFSASSEYKVKKSSVRSKFSGRDIPVELYWRKKENEREVNYILEVVPVMLDFFEDHFGAYPFEKISFATLTSDFPYGGMENQSFITLCSGCWYDLLAVHEFAHQWFGDLITPANWEDVWLNEGFAEYMEAFWVERWTKPEDDQYRAVMRDFVNYYFISSPQEAISESKWNTSLPPGEEFYNPALIYKKAACVIYMLREEVGKEKFLKILKQYTTDPKLQFGNAKTSDFISVTNEVTGRDYNWFFDQWLKYPGHPVYVNRFRFLEENGVNILEATFIQEDWERLYYKSSFELQVKYEDGTSELFTGFNSGNGETFRFKVKPGADTVIFDPSEKIILKKVF